MKYVLFLPLFVLLGACSKNSSSPTAGTSPSGSSTWSTTTVDSVGDVGAYTSIASDANGHPRISYLNRDSGTVMYMESNGASWIRHTVGSAAGPYVLGGRSSLALDASGNPHLIYHQADISYFYSERIGSNWSSPLAIGFFESAWAFLGHNSIAVDKVTGAVHVSLWFFDSHNGYLLAYWGPGMMNAEVVDGYQGHTGKNNSIALDPNGIPFISYEGQDDSNNVLLKYAHRAGSVWQTGIVDTIQTTEGYAHLTSIAVDNAGNPRIAYYSHREAAYKYASWNGSTWDRSVVQKFTSVGWEDVSLALDPQGNPHIAMLTGSYQLKHASRSGTSWVVETVDTNSGLNCSIAVAPDGSVLISYYDDAKGDLKYARKAP